MEEKLYNHPEYYKNENGEECIDVMIKEFGAPAVINFCVCNSFKYKWRAGKKSEDGSLDEKKAEWYDKKAKELAEGLFV